MTLNEIKSGTAMPLSSPYFNKGPFEFRNREYLIISYETDVEALRRVVPEPLELDLDNGPIVKYEFIKMPDSNAFGGYEESGQVIPVKYNGKKFGYTHAMYLDDVAPIAGGREIWGFPKKYAHPHLRLDSVTKDCIIGELKYGELEVARATMGYKWQALDKAKIAESMKGDNILLKYIPHVDGTPRICELVQYNLSDITVKEAWTGPVSLELFAHALAPVADLPVRRVVGGVHYTADLTLGLGKVVFDYLK